MKKKILAAAAAIAAFLSFSTSAFAAASDASDGEAEQAVTTAADEAADINTTDSDPESDVSADTIEDGADTNAEADDQSVDETIFAAAKQSVEEAVMQTAGVSADEANVSVNAVVSVSPDGEGVEAQSNGSVKVTVHHDGKSNAAAYVNDGVVEFFELTVDGDVCSFETSRSSDHYMISVEESVIGKITGHASNFEEKSSNPSSGVVLAVAPAALAVAFVGVTAIISKKKRS